jgi:hypothetical protein
VRCTCYDKTQTSACVHWKSRMCLISAGPFYKSVGMLKNIVTFHELANQVCSAGMHL